MKQVALVVPVNEEKKVLLQHKSKSAPNNADIWCLFGGALENGESPKEAAKREFREELQVDLSDLNFLTESVDYKKQLHRFYFLSNFNIDLKILKRQQLEGDDVEYFSLGEMENLKINRDHYQTLVTFLGRNNI